ATPVQPVGAQEIAISHALGDSVGTYGPFNVIDGRTDTMWNSGGYAPQSITLDLGNYYSVSTVRFNVQKTPAGGATHRIVASPCANSGAFSQQFTELATNGQWHDVQTTFGGVVRYVTVETTVSPSWVAWNEIEVYGVLGSFEGSCSQVGGGEAQPNEVVPIPSVVGCATGSVVASLATLSVDQFANLSSTISGQAVVYSSSNQAVLSVQGSRATAVGSGIAIVTGRYMVGDRVCSLAGFQVTVRPQITGIQGYDAQTREYSNSQAVAGKHVVLYGHFSSSNDNTVEIGGIKGEITYQSDQQINVLLGTNIGTGNASFTVVNQFGTSNTRSIKVVANEPVLAPTPTPTSVPVLTPPTITGIEGYDSVTGTYGPQAVSGEFVVLYGTFATTGNVVVATGTSASVTFESAGQINVRIGSTIGNTSFSVQNSSGTSGSRSIIIGPRWTPFVTPTPTPTPLQIRPIITDIQGYDSVTQTYSNTEAIAGQFIALYGSFSPNKDNTVTYGSIDYQDASRINIRIGSLVGVVLVSVNNPNGTSNSVTIRVIARPVPTPTPTTIGCVYAGGVPIGNCPTLTPTPTPTPTPAPTVASYDINVSAADASVCPATSDRATINFSGSVSNAIAGASLVGDEVTLATTQDGVVLSRVGFIELTPGNYITNGAAGSYSVSMAGTYSVAMRFAGQYRTSRIVVITESCAPTTSSEGGLYASPSPVVVYSGGAGVTIVTGRNTGATVLTLSVDGIGYTLLPSTTRQVFSTIPVGTSKVYTLTGEGFSQVILVAAQSVTL
nr:hypothetical protein [Candidatus Doudnabacteria bacterium]